MPYLEGDYVVGGTVFWYDYFNNRNELELFDSTASYPFGTLILIEALTHFNKSEFIVSTNGVRVGVALELGL